MTRGNPLDGSLEAQSLHLVVSDFKDGIWIKPSRPCNRHRVIGMLMDAIAILQDDFGRTVYPEDCPLRVVMTFDEDQKIMKPDDD